jgi:hypothetical protein
LGDGHRKPVVRIQHLGIGRPIRKSSLGIGRPQVGQDKFAFPFSLFAGANAPMTHFSRGNQNIPPFEGVSDETMENEYTMPG